VAVFTQMPEESTPGVANREVAGGEAVAGGEDLGDAAAVAGMPIGLVAQQAGRRRRGDCRGVPEL
jgi:hypothetical protein